MMSPRHIKEPIRRACNLSDVHGTRIMTSATDGGSIAMTLGGRWLGCQVAACGMSNCHDISRNQVALSRTPSRSGASLPLDTLSAIRWLNLTQPQVALWFYCPTPPSYMPRRVPRAARRGASSVARRLRLTRRVASTGKQAALVWSMLWWS
jgi:hypothetical protein